MGPRGEGFRREAGLNAMKTGPLAGLKVVEFAQVLAGPVAGLMLSDMGAEVIKVEKLPGGDDTRRFAPLVNGESTAFLMVNRGKRSVALNLKDPGARDAALALVRDADVVIENFRKGTMDKLGLGYAALAAVNPALIYLTVTGYGLTGPDADKGGFDLIAQGVSGLMRVTGHPGMPPAKVGSPVCDINAGVLGALGVVSAYVHRLKTGEGQHVDTSLLEAGVQQTYWQAAALFGTGIEPGPLGSAHPLTAPYQAFETADGWINLGGANDANWTRICHAVGQPELLDDARFATNAARMQHLPALIDLLTPGFRARPSAHWIALFGAAGIPVGPVNTVSQALADPQVRARGMVVEAPHPVTGTARSLGLPIKFSGSPMPAAARAPLLGEHTRDSLAQAGLPDADIDALLVRGAALAANA
jgi:crotonobetainyl-CoA:carnitine CoA-transferase CaiB-like acyl-CoA transferase